MIPVLLTQIKTRDSLILEGIYVKPKRKSKTALIWLHGLSSRFSSGQDLIKELSSRCRSRGIGYFKFNTRGHDIVTKGIKGHLSKSLIGSGFENFEDCVLDIKAMIRLARKLGFKNIVLAGHSTGANKALYYLYKTRDRSVKGLMLLGPMSDIVVEIKQKGMAGLKRGLAIAERLKRKNPLALMPRHYGIYTASRYLSLCKEGLAEDVFQYYHTKSKWTALKSVRVPMAVIIGSHDEHLDRKPQKLIEVFKRNAIKAKSFTGLTIKGASHGFQGREKELAGVMIRWIKDILPKT